MMKSLVRIAGIALLAAISSGCFIQSFHPFYTEDSVIDMPAIKGKWLLVKSGGEDIAGKYPQPWAFEEDQITTFEGNVSSVLDVKYFKIENATFVDVTPSEPDEDKGPNEWWMIHTIPVHSVCKVDLSGDSLNLTPLDGSWVEKMLEEKKVSISHVATDEKGDQIVLTASSRELTQFLKEHGNNAEAFPDGAPYRFRRVSDRKERGSGKPATDESQ